MLGNDKDVRVLYKRDVESGPEIRLYMLPAPTAATAGAPKDPVIFNSKPETRNEPTVVCSADLDEDTILVGDCSYIFTYSSVYASV